MAEYPSMTGTESSASSANSWESTILPTDIVGSTALLRRYPNDIMGAMDLHDQILHAAVRRRSGDPFRHTGDGVLAIFERPVDAVLAAIDAQRGMHDAAWGPTGRLQIRFGIHTGLTRARGETDFFGPALPTATRLQGAANADQILLSGVTAERLATEVFAQGGAGVPLYHMPRLGSGEGLRGQKGWRYRDLAVLAPDAQDKLLSYVWPGNARELENVIERALLFADGTRIRLEDLAYDIRGASSPDAVRASSPAPTCSQERTVSTPGATRLARRSSSRR